MGGVYVSVLMEGGPRLGEKHAGELRCHKRNDRTIHRASFHKYVVVGIKRRWVVLAQESLALSGVEVGGEYAKDQIKLPNCQFWVT